MTDPANQQPKPPLHLSAAMEPGFVGESSLFSATGYGAEGHTSLMYRSYQPGPEESPKSVIAGLAQIAETGVMGIGVVESMPIVALPGDSAESLKARWEALRLLSNANVVVEEIEPHPNKGPEVLRQEIGTEMLRALGHIVERYIQSGHRFNNPDGPKLDIDWTQQRAVQNFVISGTGVPAWLKGKQLQISTDGTLIKIAPPPSYDTRFTTFEGPIQVVSADNGNSVLRSIDEPLQPRESMSREYRDLEEQHFPGLLHTMQHLRRASF